MRAVGFWLIGLGAIVGVGALMMTTTVESAIGPVANLDLMHRQQMYVIVAALIVLSGVIMAVFGQSSVDKRLVDPFDDADRRTEIERKNYAVSIGITREDGNYRYRGEAFVELDGAIDAAERHRTGGLSSDQRAARLEADRAASAKADRIMIAAGGCLFAAVAAAFIIFW